MRYLVKNFLDDVTGAMTALGLFLLVTSFVIGGLALDVASAYQASTQLQATADAAAHAALYVRNGSDAATAKAAALAVAERMMPQAEYGVSLTAENIQFGHWDAASRTFIPDSASDEAVFVDIARMTERANPVGTYFLQFAGIGHWDVRRGSVFETYRWNCGKEGMIGDGIVDGQSNNTYVNGFCIHSNTHVEFNSNNSFDDTVSVTMPYEEDLVIPTSGFDSNTGLQDALGSKSYQLRILNQLPAIMAGLQALDGDYLPGYITNPFVRHLTKRNLEPSDFTPGQVHTLDCSGNQQAQIGSTSVLRDVVLVTNCKVQFGSNLVMENVIIATRNTDKRSLNAASTLILGRNDDCAPGGGVQLLTFGGVEFASDLHMYGSQILALGDIAFAANADGVQGAHFMAGGEIDGTSNAVLSTCGGAGMEGNFEADYFRMAA